jgi:hypothetical protein
MSFLGSCLCEHHLDIYVTQTNVVNVSAELVRNLEDA